MRRFSLLILFLSLICLSGCVHVLPEDEVNPDAWSVPAQTSEPAPGTSTQPTTDDANNPTQAPATAPETQQEEPSVTEPETDRDGFPNQPDDEYTKRY